MEKNITEKKFSEHSAKPNKPVKKFKAGAVTATVWENPGTTKEGNVTTYKTVSFERRYKDKNGEWKTASSLRLNDLPKAVVALNKAYEFLVLQNKEFQEEVVL